MSRLTYTADMAEDITTKQPTASGVIEHLCEHPACGEWGGFGLSSGRTPRWWCWEHYPYKEPGSTRAGGALQG